MQIKHRVFGLEIKAISTDGTFEGYLSVFGNVDSYGEIVMPGAFSECLAALETAKKSLPILWQHDSASPIGVWTSLVQDEKGLRVTGKLILDVQQAREAYALMQAGAVSGLSIGYYTIKSTYDEQTGIRMLSVLNLVEGSVVTFPANDAAQVDAIKTKLAAGERVTLREFEEMLREKGFSRSQAVEIAAQGYKNWSGRETEPESALVPLDFSALDGIAERAAF